jgi:DNA invertase Pin-like site-specific DNA recombinase
MTTVGYARVSTTDQNLDRQVGELSAAGCERVFTETGSGKKDADRPVFAECLSYIRPEDTLVVTELSRLGRSTSALASLADDLRDRGVGLRILNLGVDTTTPAGKLVYSIIAAVAEMERELLIERTHSGLAAARARGRKGGRRRSITDAQVRRAQKLYDERELSMEEIARVTRMSVSSLHRYLELDPKSA